MPSTGQRVPRPVAVLDDEEQRPIGVVVDDDLVLAAGPTRQSRQNTFPLPRNASKAIRRRTCRSTTRRVAALPIERELIRPNGDGIRRAKARFIRRS